MMNIIILNITGILSYISKEMIYPIIPLYLTTNYGLSTLVVGLFEGISKSLASIVKFYGGYASDKKQNRKKFIIIGYIGTFIYNIMLFITNTGIWVLIAKLIERMSKGIRISSKDAMLAEEVNYEKYGSIFGIQKFFDKLGAIIGILIVYLLITKYMISDYKLIFIIASIPTVLTIFLLFFLKQTRHRSLINIDFKKINKNIQILFIIIFISALGNSTKVSLLLWANYRNFNTSGVILLYLVSNLSSCLLSYPIGKLCDKFNKKYMISMAYLIFSLTFFTLGKTNNYFITIGAFLGYGLFIALINISTKSYIIKNVPCDMKATALGINEFIIGIASLPGTIIFGLLWDYYNPTISMYFSGFIGLISSTSVLLFISSKKD